MIESGSHEARKLILPKNLFLVSWVPDYSFHNKKATRWKSHG